MKSKDCNMLSWLGARDYGRADRWGSGAVERDTGHWERGPRKGGDP